MSALSNPLLDYNVGAGFSENYSNFLQEYNIDPDAGSYAPKPQDYGSDYEAYDAALSEWYATTDFEALTRDADRQLWAVQGYNAGDLSAEDAQAMWDEAFNARAENYGGDVAGDGYTEVTTDDDGNQVVQFYTSDGFLRNTTTYDRVVFGEDDTSGYASYVETVGPKNEQFTRSFWDGFMKSPFSQIAMTVAATALAGPLAAQLGTMMGPAAAKAASSAIINAASQLVSSGEVDWTQALISAATAYGGAKLGDLVSTGTDGALGGAIDGLKEFGETASEFFDTATGGNELIQAAIKAGGMSAVTQLVMNGEVDIAQVAVAAVTSLGAEGWKEFQSEMAANGIGADEYMQDLAEYEEFQQAAIDADIKDPFLNPNYETVGDGLIINIDTGNVYGYGSDESLGTIDDLDLDGDGMLSGNDLQEITTPDRELVDPIIRPDNNFGYELGDTVYVDANGNPVDPGMVKFGANGYTYMGEPVEATTYDQVFGGDKGGLKWEFGINEDGSVSTTDGVIRYENGELAYEKIDGQWQDADGNIIDDPAKVDELTLIAAKEIDAPLESVEYFDQDGNPITYKYAPHGLRDNLEQGQFSGLIFGPNGEVQEVWYDPQTGTEYIKSEQGFQEVNRVEMPEPDPVEPEQVEPEQIENNDSSANADPNDSTDAGEGDSGGGETDSTGGSGASGSVGGGGTTGGGAPAGGSSGGSSNDAVVDINNPLAGGNVSEDNTVNDETVNDDTVADPSDGTGTPVAPPMNAQIEALMKRGMSYEEAVANQNAAISAGADANSDGMVTNAEWAAHSNGLGGDGGSTGGTDTGSGTGGAGGGSGSGSGSTGGGDVGAGTGTGTGGSGSGSGDSGNTAGGNGTGGGLGNGGGSGPGTGGGTNGGTGPGGSTGAGTGSGTEPGSGGGAGGGGVGGPPGNGAGMLGGSGDNSNPTWGPLFPGKQFQKFEKRRSGVIQSLFEDLMK